MNQPQLNLENPLRTLRWVVPLGFAFLAAVFQLGPANWVHERFSPAAHYVVEILFYSTTGPVLAYWALTRLAVWLEERAEVEQQAQLNERRLASVTSASADAILMVDPHGRIETWNRGAALLFGYTETEARGRLLSDLFSAEEGARVEVAWLLEQVQAAGLLQGHETRCRDRQGKELAVELTAARLVDEAGKMVGMSVVMRDITGRKRREDEIRRLNARLNQQVEERTRELADKVAQLAQANEDLQKMDQTRAEFISLVSHQIRAPLTNIRGAVERMRGDCSAINATCGRMFLIIDDQIARMDRLVEDVLHLNRIEEQGFSLHPEPIAILPVINAVVEQVAARTGTRHIRVPTKPGLPLAYADRDRVAEVLLNLIDNADKYTPPEEEIHIEVRADQSEITVAVRDFGPGVPEPALARLFAKFYRADSSDAQEAYGYGLGLYICRRLVEAHGGRIWAENHPQGGARFSFSLPVWQSEGPRTG